MNRRILPALLLCLAIASPALAVDSGDQPTPWWFRGLTFHAPFDDPASPLKLLRGAGSLTFTRAHDATHTATYVHPGTGLITVADNNQLRIEAGGALIETERSNLIVASASLAAGEGAWSGLGSDPSVLDNIVAPDGNLSAERWTDSAATLSGIYQGMPFSALPYSFCVYAKPVSGSPYLTVDLTNTGNAGATFDVAAGTIGFIDAGVTSSMTAAPLSYWRCCVTKTMTAATHYPEFYFSNVSNANTRAGGGKGDGSAVALWGATLEQAPFPSSYIPTVVSAMFRNRDSLTGPSGGNLLGTAGTFSAEVQEISPDPPATNQGILNADAAGNLPIAMHGDAMALLYSDGTTLGEIIYYEKIGVYKIAVSWGGATVGGAVDGALGTPGPFDGDFNVGANFLIGDQIAGLHVLNGHIKNLRIWNRAFTDSELQTITR